eukprot:TCALIF_00165-PA protein Name:"Similar to PTPRA Receptor-type tyrosine-protein phosphatase alpha (Homo sapiens)" AED:0.04 eAED:0.13 QI:144/0.75/0.8/1/0.75/0.6/5/0/421
MKSLSKRCFLRGGDDDGLGKERQHFVSGPKYCSDSELILRRLSKTLRPPKEGVNEAKFSVTTLMISVVVAIVLMAGVMASLVRRYSQRTERDYNSLDLAVDVGHPIPVTKLISLVQRKVVPLPNEFKRLTDTDRAKNIIAKSREIGKSKLNISLNRVRHILPYDECRLILNTKIEDSDYINASIMLGTPDIGNLIACQIPSDEVEDHYWQMIAENPICVVVNLDESSLWTTNANNMNVQLRSGTTIILKEHSTQTNKSKSMTKTSYRFNSRQVEHFSFNAWNKHQIPKDLSTFCSLIESVIHLSKTELNHTKGSILVQCNDGSTKSGFFIACLVLAHELGIKSEMSVYKTVFALRECRSHVIQSDIVNRFCLPLFLQVPTEFQYRAVYEVVSMLAKIHKRRSSKRKSSVRAAPSSSIITTV